MPSFESTVQSIQERSLQAKALLVTGLASFAVSGALHNAEEAAAYGRGVSSTQSNGDMLRQEARFNPQSGRTVCEVEKRDEDTLFGSQIVMSRVEKRTRNGWEVAPRYPQPFATGESSEEDPHRVETVLATQYPAKILQKHDRKIPLRINCLTGDTQFTLPIQSQAKR